MVKSSFYNQNQSCIWVLVGALVFFTIAASIIGLPAVGSSSEAREGQVVNSILESNSWILPLRNGLVPSKPPLFHWVGASLAKVAGQRQGINEYLLRLPSLIAALGTVLITIGLAYFRSRYIKKTNCGLRACLVAFVLVTTYGFFRMIYDGRVDMVFTVFTTAAIAIPGVAVIGNESGTNVLSKWKYFCFYFFCSLAVLAKGPLGLALPLLVFLAYLWNRYGLIKALKELTTPRLGWLIFFIISVGYYYAAAAESSGSLWQGKFIARQIIFENYRRFLGGEGIDSDPWWFYLPALLRLAAPWTLILVALIVADLVNGRWLLKRCDRLGLLWFVAGLLLFSISTGKRHSYLLPLFPGLSLFVGGLLIDWLEVQKFKTSLLVQSTIVHLGRLLGFIGLFFVMLIEIIRLPLGIDDPSWQVARSWIAGNGYIFQIIFILVSFGLFVRFSSGFSLLCVRLALVAGLFLSISVLGQGIKNSFKPFKNGAGTVKSVVGDDLKITVVKRKNEEYFDPLFFYFGKDVGLSEDGLPQNAGYLILRESGAHEKDLRVIARFSPVTSKTDNDSFVLAYYSRITQLD